MAKIAQLCVANLGNSLAITCDLRLDLRNFISSSTRPRIDQRLLKGLLRRHRNNPLAITGFFDNPIGFKMFDQVHRADIHRYCKAARLLLAIHYQRSADIQIKHAVMLWLDANGYRVLLMICR